MAYIAGATIFEDTVAGYLDQFLEGTFAGRDWGSVGILRTLMDIC